MARVKYSEDTRTQYCIKGSYLSVCGKKQQPDFGLVKVVFPNKIWCIKCYLEHIINVLLEQILS